MVHTVCPEDPPLGLQSMNPVSEALVERCRARGNCGDGRQVKHLEQKRVGDHGDENGRHLIIQLW